MKATIHPSFKQHFREGQVGMKTFYTFSKEEKNQYLKLILDLPVEQRTTVDEHILRFHSVLPEQPVKHWLSIED